MIVGCTIKVSRKYCFGQHSNVPTRSGFSERCFTYNIQSLNGIENSFPFSSLYVEPLI